MISYVWMAKKKGTGGQYDRYVGTFLFLNEENMIRHSQLAAAVCPAKLTPEVEVASLWW